MLHLLNMVQTYGRERVVYLMKNNNDIDIYAVGCYTQSSCAGAEFVCITKIQCCNLGGISYDLDGSCYPW